MIVYLTSLIIRSTILACAAGLLSLAFRNVAARHAIWVIVLSAMLLMPVADMIIPPAVTRIPAAPQVVVQANVPLRAPAIKGLEHDLTAPQRMHRAAISTDALAGFLYICVALILMSRVAMGWLRLRKLRRSSNLTDIQSGYPGVLVYESERVLVPLTAGMFRPWIVLPKDWTSWSGAKLQAVLIHERTHIRRADWLIHVVASVNTSIYWFHPLSWWLQRHLSALAEDACDEAALASADADTYADWLLEFAANARNGARLQVGGIGMAVHRIRARIERVLALREIHTGMISRRAWFFVFLVGAAIIGFASAARLSASQPEPVTVRFQAPGAVQPQPPVTEQQTEVQTPVQVPTQAAIARVEAQRQILSIELQKLEAAQKALAEVDQPDSPARQALEQRVALLRAEIERLTAITQQSPAFMQLKEAMLERQKELDDVRHQLEREIKLKSELTFEDSELSKTYSPDHPLRRRVEEQLKEVEGEMAALNVNAAPPHMVMFAMAVSTDKTVQLQGEDSVGFGSHCADCTFFQWESGQSPQENGKPGVLIHLQKDGKHVELTCRSSVCRVIEYMGKEHNLSADEKIVVPVSGPAIVKFLG